MLNLEIAHTLLQLKEDHPKLGKEGTVFSVVDCVLDVQTGTTKALLGKPEYNEVLEQVWTLPTCTVTGEEVESLFIVLDKPLHEYEKELKKPGIVN